MPSRTTPKPVVHPTLMTLHGSLVHPTDPATRPVRVPPHKPVRVRPQASCSRTAIPPMCLPDAWSLSSHRTPHTHTTSYSAHTTRSSPMPGLPLWSAVALQQHVLQTGSPLTASLPLARYPVAAAAAAQSSSLVSSSSSCSYSSPAAVITDDWTLAQKMGLIAPLRPHRRRRTGPSPNLVRCSASTTTTPPSPHSAPFAASPFTARTMRDRLYCPAVTSFTSDASRSLSALPVNGVATPS